MRGRAVTDVGRLPVAWVGAAAALDDVGLLAAAKTARHIVCELLVVVQRRVDSIHAIVVRRLQKPGLRL